MCKRFRLLDGPLGAAGPIFEDDADEIGSVALVPLGDKADIGFLAIGSHDADRFHPGMSIDFLARVGDLVAGALKRH